MELVAQVDTAGVASVERDHADGAAEARGADGLVERGGIAADLDRDIYSALPPLSGPLGVATHDMRKRRGRLAAPAHRDGQLADGLTHVAGKRVNGSVGAERQRKVAPRLDGVHHDHLIGAGKAGQLHGHLTDSPQAEHSHVITQPDIALAQRQGHDQGSRQTAACGVRPGGSRST